MYKHRVVVIGAGISGLAAAYFVHRDAGSTVELTVLEAGNRIGGVIATHVTPDAVIEQGPEAFLTSKPHTLELVQQLGLSEHLIPTNDCHRRTFIARGEKLLALPDGFVMFAPTRWQGWAATGLVSPAAKLRMAMDLVLPRRVASSDESLSDFVQRRLGTEALKQLAEPLIAGIYGGDSRVLSAECTVPQMVQYEHDYGSIIRGLWRQAGRRKEPQRTTSGGPRYGLFASFDKGMQVLVDELSRRLPAGAVRTNSPVDFILHGAHDSAFEIRCRDGKRIPADTIIIATPANIAGQLLASVDPELGHKLMQINYLPATMVNFLFRRRDIQHKLDGFGFVVPPKEERYTGACTFSSIKFAGRTANDKVLMRVFLSSTGRKRFENVSDQEIIYGLIEDLSDFVGVTAAPLEAFVTRHQNALPQYEVGHRARVEEVLQRAGNCGGLFLAGNAYGGIGIPDCIASASKAAEAAWSKIRQHRHEAPISA